VGNRHTRACELGDSEHPKHHIIFVTAITPGVLALMHPPAIVNAPDAPEQSQEHVMRNWWIPAICAGGGALIGVAAGDWYSVSHTVGMVLAGAGAGIGAVIGSVLATKVSLS
jgi:hypothetical protein